MEKRPLETISVLIPVFNEVDNVFPLVERLIEALKKTERPYEVIFIDVGLWNYGKMEWFERKIGCWLNGFHTIFHHSNDPLFQL